MVSWLWRFYSLPFQGISMCWFNYSSTDGDKTVAITKGCFSLHDRMLQTRVAEALTCWPLSGVVGLSSRELWLGHTVGALLYWKGPNIEELYACAMALFYQRENVNVAEPSNCKWIACFGTSAPPGGHGGHGLPDPSSAVKQSENVSPKHPLENPKYTVGRYFVPRPKLLLVEVRKHLS